MDAQLEGLQEEHAIPADEIWTVSQLNQRLSDVIAAENQFRRVFVVGEVSNLSTSSNSHLFFDLKDEDAKVSCVVFNHRRDGSAYEPGEGDEVLVVGEVDYYEKEGRISIKPARIVPVGEGQYYRQLREVMETLEDEGLFAEEHKQPIPAHPERIGIVTSTDGAAVRDVVDTIRDRHAGVDILVKHAQVQGEDAVQDVTAGITFFDQRMDVDTIIVARGGGSIEDLQAFNTEAVARTIFEAATPVITGIGHRTDETVAGYAADERAITPTAAGEAAVPDQAALRDEVETLREELADAYTRFETVKEQAVAVEGIRWRERRYQAVIVVLLVLIVLLVWVAL